MKYTHRVVSIWAIIGAVCIAWAVVALGLILDVRGIVSLGEGMIFGVLGTTIWSDAVNKKEGWPPKGER